MPLLVESTRSSQRYMSEGHRKLFEMLQAMALLSTVKVDFLEEVIKEVQAVAGAGGGAEGGMKRWDGGEYEYGVTCQG